MSAWRFIGPHQRLMALYIVFLARRGDLLDLDVRRRLFEQVRQYPGLHLRELARALAIDPNHAKYHLQALERAGLVSSKREEGYWRFFPRESGPVGPADTVGAKDKGVLSLLRRPVPLHVTLLLLDRGEATLTDLVNDVRVSISTLHYHLTKMEGAGMLQSEKLGRERRYRLSDRDRMVDQLIRYRPPDSLVQGFLEAWEQLELR